ncbi:unnamed protein product [Cuscuta epithymum]|uniref:Uncharacterized protein n=1 Tax=Cuscuta epithymum TaxID=186058 RepID=A0AAV0C318_9ASTE|nr:unnamed protein product [Cuscuta epithymum]
MQPLQPELHKFQQNQPSADFHVTKRALILLIYTEYVIIWKKNGGVDIFKTTFALERHSAAIASFRKGNGKGCWIGRRNAERNGSCDYKAKAIGGVTGEILEGLATRCF